MSEKHCKISNKDYLFTGVFSPLRQCPDTRH